MCTPFSRFRSHHITTFCIVCQFSKFRPTWQQAGSPKFKFYIPVAFPVPILYQFTKSPSSRHWRIYDEISFACYYFFLVLARWWTQNNLQKLIVLYVVVCISDIVHRTYTHHSHLCMTLSVSAVVSSGGWSGSVGSVVGCISEVNQHQARLVLGWLTISVCNQPPRSTQPGLPFVGRRNEYQQKMGCKRAHRAMH